MDDRCTLLRLLCALSAESAALHDTLHGDEEEVGGAAAASLCGALFAHTVRRLLRPHLTPAQRSLLISQVREKRKEIQQMRAEVKKLQAEMAAQQQAAAAAAAPPGAPGTEGSAPGAAAGAEPGAPPAAAGAASPGAALPPLPPQRSTRRAPDLHAEVERMVEKISYLESLISQVGAAGGRCRCVEANLAWGQGGCVCTGCSCCFCSLPSCRAPLHPALPGPLTLASHCPMLHCCAVFALLSCVSPLQKGPVRLEPIGLDRHYNRYWLLPAAATASDPAHPPPPEAPPLLVIERHSLDSLVPPSVAAAAAAVVGSDAAAGGGGEPGWQVGLYNSILHLQQLAQWLNPKGARERPLADYVTRLLDRHQQWAMQHAQPPRAPMEEDTPEADPAGQRAAAVGALQAALLSFEEGNQPATYDELTGSEERRARWRAMVGAAATPQVGRRGSHACALFAQRVCACYLCLLPLALPPCCPHASLLACACCGWCCQEPGP